MVLLILFEVFTINEDFTIIYYLTIFTLRYFVLLNFIESLKYTLNSPLFIVLHIIHLFNCSNSVALLHYLPIILYTINDSQFHTILSSSAKFYKLRCFFLFIYERYPLSIFLRIFLLTSGLLYFFDCH